VDARRFDAAVLGGGPAGLSAALMLGRACRSAVVLDTDRPRNRFAAHMHGVLGHDGRPPGDLLADGRREVRRYGGAIEHASATEVVRTADGGFLIDAGSQRILARRLIVATGLTDELPPIPGLAPRWGSGVVHCPYCHGYEVRGEPLGVLATGHGSSHQAHLLRQWSDRLMYCSSGGYRPASEERAELAARGITVQEAPVASLSDPESGSGVRVQLQDGSAHDVAAVFLVPHVRPNDGVLTALGAARVTPHRTSLVAVDHAGRTTVPGVWAVGTVEDPKANVPMAIGAGAAAGGAVNADLVAAEVAAARRVAAP
jgi:thioredoxin reductase